MASNDQSLTTDGDQASTDSSALLNLVAIEHERREALPTTGPVPSSSRSTGRAGSSTNQNCDLVSSMEAMRLPPKRARLPCFMIDAATRNKDFFGREAIMSDLAVALVPSTPSPNDPARTIRSRNHVALRGMGGLGKTSIAVEFVSTHQSSFDAIFWVHAEDEDKLAQDFVRIAILLELQDATEKADPLISREMVMSWLANPRRVLDDEHDRGGREVRWLLVFDNADRPEILQDYWPVSETGSILITSRSPLSATTPSKATKVIDIPLLDEAAAVQLFCKLSHRDPSQDGCLEVVRCLGGLPLAIAQIAATIRRLGLSFPEFLSMYQDRSSVAKLHASQELDALGRGARGNIATVWAIGQLSVGAQSLIKVLAMLDPDAIPEQILKAFSGTTQTTFPGYPADPMDYFDARGELLRNSIISRNEDREELIIHRVVQDSVKATMSWEEATNAYSAAVSLVKSAWGDTPLAKRHDWALSMLHAPLFPHTSCLKEFFERYRPPISMDTILDLGGLMNEAAWWQHERGGSFEAKGHWQMALDLSAKGHPGSLQSQSLASDAHYGISAAAMETNDPQACLEHTLLLRNQRLKIYSETQVVDLRLAIAHNEYAIGCTLNGRFDEARREYERSIEVFSALPEKQLAMDTNPRTNLGFLFWLTGELSHADAIFQSLLRDREVRWGPNDRESYRGGRVRHGLGNVRFSQCRYDESRQLHQQALEQYQEILGNNSHKTADLYHRVAIHLLRENELTECQTFIDQALDVYNRRKQAFRPEIARTTFLKSQLLGRQGDAHAARAALEEAQRLRNSIPGVHAKSNDEVNQVDFDSLVAFFSR